MLRNLDRRIQIGIGVVVVIALYFGYQMFGTATIAITSEPQGAVVRIDGRQRGLTPISRLELDSGNHRIEVLHTHYLSHVEGIRLSRGDHLRRHIKFGLGEGTFEFLSNPRGAWVEVDGERVQGRTPVKVTTSSGPHVIRMGREERYIVEQAHTIKAGQNLEVNFNLNIDPHGTLTVAVAPRNAKVEFIGEKTKYEPKMRIRIGEYALRVSRSGYVPQEFRYKVRYGDNLHSVRLERQYADLRVNVKPQGSEILVMYEDDGRTYRKDYTGTLRIPTGRVEVRVRASGHRTEHKRIRMGGQGATVRFNLTKMQVRTGDVIKDPLEVGGHAPEMVIVPNGSFIMGDAAGTFSEKPARKVTITQPFAMSKFEVSVGDYVKFSHATGRDMDDRIATESPDVALNYVSFKDADAYTTWLTEQTGQKYRMPSEAEWEYAARAGSSSDYFFGDDPMELCKYANIADLSARKSYRDWEVLHCDDGLIRPGPGGTYAPNPFGLYDLYGNVSEWVLDCGLASYQGAPTDGSPTEQGSGCPSHGIRGGSWDSTPAEAKSAYRNTASNENDDRGVRLVREL
jgi:formylglycine-generating enzyme required for sulfatase activity